MPFGSEARKKLIEVALPLDAINKASAREKSIRHGHPSTLHLWWPENRWRLHVR
jgi:putative DNA methylase